MSIKWIARVCVLATLSLVLMATSAVADTWNECPNGSCFEASVECEQLCELFSCAFDRVHCKYDNCEWACCYICYCGDCT